MADANSKPGDDAKDRPSGGDDPGQAGGGDTSGQRDFGDSAGYGSGGSTIDRRDLGADDPDSHPKPNPLDKVMDTSRSSES